ncbi:MAG: hypothetical protein JJ992_13470, partial [Planctomycetes bacterium]|nr:hypothetical protein [Planctomycetota bacterium]
DPKDFGFDRLQKNEMSVFITSTAGFEDDEKRKEAFKKWHAFCDSEKSTTDDSPSPAGGDTREQDP